MSYVSNGTPLVVKWLRRACDGIYDTGVNYLCKPECHVDCHSSTPAELKCDCDDFRPVPILTNTKKDKMTKPDREEREALEDEQTKRFVECSR